MNLRKVLYSTVAAVGLAAFSAPVTTSAWAQQAAAVAIDNDDIGGVVTGPKGPEGGVWVIAETTDLPTKFARIVVTDDQGRYVIPDLPKANYDVWVRGYGLVDSPRVKSAPGKLLNLTAVPAPSEAAAGHYYPAIYWYSMMKLPEASVFGSKDAPANVKLTDYLNVMKNNGCVGCHQLGQLSTRTIPEYHLQGRTHQDAWVRRIQSGQAGENMVVLAAGQLGGMPFKYLGDWTERVAKGELPHAKPTRPQGVERIELPSEAHSIAENAIDARDDAVAAALDALCRDIEHSALSQALQSIPWAAPTLQTMHLLAIAALMSAASLRWISSKAWPSDGSMTGRVRSEDERTEALPM